MRRWLLLGVIVLAPLVRADDPTTRSSGLDGQSIESGLRSLGDHPDGEMKDGVLCITAPRDDLQVTIEGMPVPTAAGIASNFWFYYCPCGRTRLVGQMAVCDYEVDDVDAALRDVTGNAAADVHVDSIAPMFSSEKPAMRIIRFHGEGRADALGARVASALQYVGPARNKKSTTLPSK